MRCTHSSFYFFSTTLKIILVTFCVSFTSLAFSQVEDVFLKKLSPRLSRQFSLANPDSVASFVVAVSDQKLFKSSLIKSPGITIFYEYDLANVLLIRCTWQDLIKKIVPLGEVIFIDKQRTPKEEVAVSNLDMSANKVNLLHSRYPVYNGQSLTVSIKENRPDSADIDFKGRYFPTAFTAATLSGHATIMTSIIAGAGNTFYEGKGAAIAAGITSANFSNLLPEPDSYYQQNNISVQNHSYGTGIENYYGADASAYDASVITRPSLLHVFSAGNAGTLTSNNGMYTGIAGYANLTGSFKMAKNIITVGHTDSVGTVLAPSSRGPAYDGRVKPELVAFGEDGSSGAAAIVSGIALTLQHAYKIINGGLPSSALVKATLLNSADDVKYPGIDFSSGYGAANAYKAMQGIVSNKYFENSIASGGINEHLLQVPPNTKELKITLVWNDPASVANTPKALRNDADLELFFPATNETWLPWVLNHSPHIDSLQQLPKRKKDTLNNVEQISIINPVAGDYSIRVKGTNITTATQPYAMAYHMDMFDTFNWYYPTRLDNLLNGESNTLRWESNYSSVTTGLLEYSFNNGASWQLISAAADLSKNFYKWNTPDTFTTALLRMTIQGQSFVSDTFTLSKRIQTFVGFNCPDSFSFYWNKPRGINRYQVYKLGERYLEPFFITTDTFVVLAKISNPALHYSIAPLINNKTGVKSFAFNYSTQGVECYIRSFLASLSGSNADISLLLGTSYNISRIILEKASGSNFISLQTITAPNTLTFNFTDAQLHQGLNRYRIKIELKDGRIIYSEVITVYFLANADFIIYPNPVHQGQPLFVLPADLSQRITLQVINATGAKVYEGIINDLPTSIPAAKLSKGFYLFRFIKENKNVSVYKVVIQ